MRCEEAAGILVTGPDGRVSFHTNRASANLAAAAIVSALTPTAREQVLASQSAALRAQLDAALKSQDEALARLAAVRRAATEPPPPATVRRR
jgi:hypothetical protein